ncbi:MAG: heat-inducible transcriptional repressor HrcA [Armatimonadota bacterium]
MVQLDERKRAVLYAVVEAYIRSAEPVGSEHAVVRDQVKVSPATIRSTMAALEEMGLLRHPHTSAGRVPTDAGYRQYVDMLPQAEPLPGADRQAIRRRLEGTAAEPSGAPHQAARILASVTHYPSVVAAPGLRDQTFRSLHLVPLGPDRALAVIATNAGALQGCMITLPDGVEPDALEQLSRTITESLQGCRIADLTHQRLEQAVGEASWQHRLLDHVEAWLRREGARGTRTRIRVEGASHLLREPEFRTPEAATRLLELLEEESVLADALTAMPEQGVRISIGAENRRQELRACSLVMAAYRAGHQAAGTVGIVGPTRMRYRQAMTAVRYVADRLSEALDALG